ncbi:MAG: transcription elongation factor GreA [Erysipelotrichaceae bacterium]|nr:transcription elongation factor GreA [Erysipelotrichaceae bacterium]
MDEKYYVTEEGLADLKKELETLIHVTRNEVIEELKAARAQGDLSENADYDAARDHQAQVESRIKELEYMIRNAEIINEKRSTKYVRLGSTVELLELDTNETDVYTIVGSVEADPLNGKLSNVTPLAVAILDQRVGSTVTVEAEIPYQVKIVKVS